MKYIKGFDSLRALSIFLVIFTHLGLFYSLPENEFVRERVWLLISGGMGVRMFFTLSGFLITTILLVERRKYGKINFRFFFARRFLRLFPPLLVFFFLIALLMKLHMIPATSVGLVLSVFYLYNFVPNKFYTGELGHTWTLAIEEQFYLVWPFVIHYVGKYRSLIKVILLLIFLCVVVVFVYPNVEGQELFKVGRWFIPAVAPIMIGSCFSILQFNKPDWWCDIVSKEKALVSSGFVLFLFPLYTPFVQLTFVFQSIGIGLLLLWISENQNSKVVSILDNKLLNYVGKISYGLYVYQGLFLRTGSGGELWIQQFPQNIGLTFILAVASFHLLEKPILRYKNRFVNK